MKPDPFILECCKTGRWWACTSQADGDRLARKYGLTDYIVSARA